MFCCAGYEEGIESVDSQDTSILLLDPECLDAQVFTLGLLRGPQVGDFYISSKTDLVGEKKEYLK
jgi:hypothetical protein